MRREVIKGLSPEASQVLDTAARAGSTGTDEEPNVIPSGVHGRVLRELFDAGYIHTLDPAALDIEWRMTRAGYRAWLGYEHDDDDSTAVDALVQAFGPGFHKAFRSGAVDGPGAHSFWQAIDRLGGDEYGSALRYAAQGVLSMYPGMAAVLKPEPDVGADRAQLVDALRKAYTALTNIDGRRRVNLPYARGEALAALRDVLEIEPTEQPPVPADPQTPGEWQAYWLERYERAAQSAVGSIGAALARAREMATAECHDELWEAVRSGERRVESGLARGQNPDRMSHAWTSAMRAVVRILTAPVRTDTIENRLVDEARREVAAAWMREHRGRARQVDLSEAFR